MADKEKKTFFLDLYAKMLLVRLVEEKIVELYPQQEMRCPVHLCIGQEAVSAGVCCHFKKEDFVLSNHRAHGHYLAKGGSLKAMLAEIYGKKTGCSKGRGGSMHLIDLSVNFLGSTPIVGSIIPVATGVAFAEQLKKRDTITVVFFGDAAVEEGVFHESVNFAALKKLPIIYVCENNLYSVYTNIRDRQPARPIHQLAGGHGISVFQEDGNDVLKVEETTRKAINALKTTGGPVFLEFATYRWREHCGPNYDNNIGYRTQKEFEQWEAQCPVRHFKDFLLKENLTDIKNLEKIQNDIEKEINEAVRFAKESEFPAEKVSVDDVYAK